MQIHAPVTAVGIVVVTTVPHVQIAALLVAYLYYSCGTYRQAFTLVKTYSYKLIVILINKRSNFSRPLVKSK